jgi:hypothetical protein
VAYDLWLAPSSTAANKYEIMVWLAAYGGAGPISSTGSTPIATPTINGVTWNLFEGPNGDTSVFSFVASQTITNWSGDMNKFFSYLVSSQGVSSSMVITSLQAGTEPFTGELSETQLPKYRFNNIHRFKCSAQHHEIHHFCFLSRGFPGGQLNRVLICPQSVCLSAQISNDSGSVFQLPLL